MMPDHLPSAAPDDAQHSETTGASSAAKKVLVAADAETLALLERAFDDRQRYRLITADSGEQVLELVVKEEPDLIVMDIYLAGLRGDACCHALKNDAVCRQIPVVLIVFPEREADSQRSRRAGCDAVITKPVDPRRLEEIGARLLDSESRSVVQFRVRIVIHHGSEPQKLLSDYSVNLSTGGMFLESDTLLPEDTPLTVDFSLPATQVRITTSARVAWVNAPPVMKKPSLPRGMGLKFVGLSTDELAAIRDFLSSGVVEASWQSSTCADRPASPSQ